MSSRGEQGIYPPGYFDQEYRDPVDRYDDLGRFLGGLRKDPYNTEREEILRLVDSSPELAFTRIVRKLQSFSSGNRAYFKGKPVDIAYKIPDWRMTGVVLTIKGFHSDTLYPVVKAQDDAKLRSAFFESEKKGPYGVKLGVHYDPSKENPLTFGIAWEAFYHHQGGDTPAGNKLVGPELFVATVFTLTVEAPQVSNSDQRPERGPRDLHTSYDRSYQEPGGGNRRKIMNRGSGGFPSGYVSPGLVDKLVGDIKPVSTGRPKSRFERKHKQAANKRNKKK